MSQNLVTLTIEITAEQEERLRRLASERGMTENDVIRIAIDTYALANSGRVPDADSDTAHFASERQRIKEAQKARGWTRDDLYEERLARLDPDRHERPGLRS